jgi:perosamine synthetase
MTIPWWTVQLSGSEKKYISEVLDSNYLNEGQTNEEFENLIAKLVGVKHAITTTSGTIALFLALKAKGIGPGDVVLVPNLTFIATATAVKLTGATVQLAEVDLLDMTIQETEIQRAVDNGISAIIPVHVSGRSAWNGALRKIRNENRIPIIEDAAEAFGSKDPKTLQHLGSLGTAGIFSFSPNKIITTGQGGAIVTNEDEIMLKIRAMKDQGRPSRGTGGADLHPMEGYNFKFTNLQAAVGLAQVEQISIRIAHLTEIYNLYRKSIKDCSHVRLFPFNTDNGEFPLWPELWAREKIQIQEKLRASGIGYRNIWFPLNTQPVFKNLKEFPNSQELSSTTIWLPSSFELTPDQVLEISRLINCEICK